MIFGFIGETFGAFCLGAFTNRVQGPLQDYERRLRAALRTGQPKNNHIPRTVLDCAAGALNLLAEQERRSFDVQASIVEQQAVERFQARLSAWTKGWVKAKEAAHDDPELKLLSAGILSGLADGGGLVDPAIAEQRRAAAVAVVRRELIAATDPSEAFLRAFDGGSDGPGWFENFASLVAEAIKHDKVFEAIFGASTLATMQDMLATALLDLRALREARAQDSETLRRIATEILPDLDLVRGYDALPADQVRRLPTALVVADHGIVPYLDDRALKAGLIGWAGDPGQGRIAGRLYAAGAGFGKTRLCLDAIEQLNAAGWVAGFLPQAALDAIGASGSGEGQRRLARLFATPGAAGILLVLDYAETRPGQIEQVVATALRAPGDMPVRIVALARSAGGWWQGLLDVSRDVARVFDRAPVVEIEQPMSGADRETLFHSAHGRFVAVLREAQSGTHPLLPDEPGVAAFPGDRLSGAAVSPIEIVFEAYLAARGIVPEESALAEMARDEQRHWLRALRADDGFAHAPALPDGALLAAAGLTLRRGEGFASPQALEQGIDALVEAALGDDFLAGATMAERARGYGAIRRTIAGLYADDRPAAPRLRPILPDLLGEHLVARALDHDPALFRRVTGRFPDGLRDAARVIARATKPPHVAATRDVARRLISGAFRDDVRPEIEAFMAVSLSELVPLDAIVGEILYLLPSATLADIPLLGGLNSIVQSRLNAMCMRECQRRVAAGGSIRMSLPDGMEIVGGFTGVRDMPEEDVAVEERAMWACNAASYSSSGEAVRLIDEAEAGFASLIDRYPHVRPLLAEARILRMRRYRGCHDVAGLSAAFDLAWETIAPLESEGHPCVALLRLYIAEEYLDASKANHPDTDRIALLSERLLEAIRADALSATAFAERAASYLSEASATLVRLGGNPEDSLAHAQAGVQLLRLALEDAVERPGDADLRLADGLINLSLVLDHGGQPEASMQASLEAVDLIRRLFEHYPKQFGHKYAKSLDNVAVDYARREEFRTALDYGRKALAIFDEAGSMEDMRGMEDVAAAASNAAMAAYRSDNMLSGDIYLDLAAVLYGRIVRDYSVVYPNVFENFQRLYADRARWRSDLH